MIGINLPVGTKIECIDGNYEPVKPSTIFTNQIYTLESYVESYGEFYIYLTEITFCAENRKRVCYSRDRFRVVQSLPQSLLNCLNVKELV